MIFEAWWASGLDRASAPWCCFGLVKVDHGFPDPRTSSTLTFCVQLTVDWSWLARAWALGQLVKEHYSLYGMRNGSGPTVFAIGLEVHQPFMQKSWVQPLNPLQHVASWSVRLDAARSVPSGGLP